MENSTKEEPLNETTPLIKPDSRPIGSTNSINTKLSNGVATGDGISDTDSLLNKELQPDVIPPGRTNVFGATFVVTNAALGAGMLTFPYAFYLAGGWYWGVTTEIVLVPFIIGSLLMLAYCAELSQAVTIEQAMGSILGRPARYITEVLVLVYCFGCCIALLVVMGDQIEDVTEAFKYHNQTLSTQWWASRKFLIPIISVILIYPWLYLKKIGFLSYTSFLGVTACAYITVVVVVKYFILDIATLDECNVKFDSDCSNSWMTTFNSIPFVCFGFQCHVSSIPVYSGLKKRNIKNFFGIVLAAVVICITVYTLTGVFGELTFSSKCIKSDILMNYCPTDIPISVARGMLFLSLITSYPILAFCGRVSVESMLTRLGPVLTSCIPNRIHKKLTFPHKLRCCCTLETLRSILISNVWMILSLVLALFVPAIKYVISPLGSLAAMFIFVLPGLCCLKLSLAGHFSGGKCTNIAAAVVSCATVSIGFFILGDDFVYNIMEYIK